MSGVNLIDFTMPSAVPTSAGGTKRVGGFQLVIPKKTAEPEEKREERGMDWWRVLGAALALLGIFLVFKIGEWIARRGEK